LPELPILKLFCLLVFLQVRNPKISPIIKLKKIEQDNFDDIHDKTKYRLLVDIAVAYGRQNKEQEASEYLIYAKKYSEDCRFRN
jgi:hypothetical protein